MRMALQRIAPILVKGKVWGNGRNSQPNILQIPHSDRARLEEVLGLWGKGCDAANTVVPNYPSLKQFPVIT